MTQFKQTAKTRVRRLPKRGHYDRGTIYRILDEALICHVGFVEHEQPVVIPINFARMDDVIVLHGAKASRLLKHVEAGHPVCVEATIVDGLVLARSVFHHSLNYRSVVLFGTGRAIEGPDEKMAALEAITEYLIPGRWKEARRPNRNELNATRVVAIRIDEASAMASTRAAFAAMDTYGKLGYPKEKIKLVLNATFARAGLSKDKIESALGIPSAMVIPYTDTLFVEAINYGRPPVDAKPAEPVCGLLEDFGFYVSRDEHKKSKTG